MCVDPGEGDRWGMHPAREKVGGWPIDRSIVIIFFFLQGCGNVVFFLGGGGKNVDMPSDCQYLGGGGTGISIPLRQKVGGGGQFPPAPAPLSFLIILPYRPWLRTCLSQE